MCYPAAPTAAGHITPQTNAERQRRPALAERGLFCLVTEFVMVILLFHSLSLNEGISS